jgi:TolA-binding protein
MDFFTFLFLTVLIGCSIPLMKLWQDGRRQRLPDSQVTTQLQRQVDALQQRVEVLEKIVTDQKYQLQRELASLDDTP